MFLNKMTKEEFEDLLPDRLSKKLNVRNGCDYRYGKLGNFTLVLFVSPLGQVWAGIAKRSPTDKESDDTGLTIAATRAAREFLDMDAGYCRQVRGQAKPAPKTLYDSFGDCGLCF